MSIAISESCGQVGEGAGAQVPADPLPAPSWPLGGEGVLCAAGWGSGIAGTHWAGAHLWGDSPWGPLCLTSSPSGDLAEVGTLDQVPEYRHFTAFPKKSCDQNPGPRLAHRGSGEAERGLTQGGPDLSHTQMLDLS